MRASSIFITLLAMAGCAPIPTAATFPVTAQPKVQAADHWRVIADEAAARVAASVRPNDQPIYIARKPPSRFTRAFETYLETALFKRGYSVVGAPIGAATIDYGIEKVEHFANRDNRPPGVLSLIGAAGAVGYGARGLSADAAAGLLGGTAIVADLALSGFAARPTNAEIILATAVIVNDRTISRETATYYVNAADLWHYPDTSIGLRRPGPVLESRPVALVLTGGTP